MRLYRSTCSIQLCLLASLLAVNIGQVVAGFAEDALAKHNELRAKHGAPVMTLDPKLNTEAQQWADKLASTNEFKHSKKSGLGENLYASMGMAVDGATAVDFWYSEICMYYFTKPQFSSSTGHFTQVVWKGSTKLGIAWAKSSDNTTYVVANYSPQGNFGGQFAANVQRNPNQNDVKNSDLCKKSTTSPQGTGTTTNTGSTGGTTGATGTSTNTGTTGGSTGSTGTSRNTEIITKDVSRMLSSGDSTKIKDCLKKLNIWYTYSSSGSSNSSGIKTTIKITVYSSDVQKVKQDCLSNL